MPVVTMTNIKGGVGKTNVTINLAGVLAKNGHKVLILDNDCQSSLSKLLNISMKYNMLDLYSNPKVTFQDCISMFDTNIYVIPNTMKSSKLEAELYQKKNRETVLKRKYDAFDHDFDFILIDNSPFMGLQLENSLCMSDYYMEVIDDSTNALEGLEMVSIDIDGLQENGLAENLKLLGILRNMFDKTTNFDKQFLEVVEEELGDKLFNTIIYRSIRYKEAATAHKTIQKYDKVCAEPYDELYTEVMNRLVK